MSNNWRTEGFTHYLDWFYTVWTGRGVPTGQQFYGILKKAGFLK